MQLTEPQKKWLAALRSGQYTQARGSLRLMDETGHCCLGVACDISNLGEWDRSTYRTANPAEYTDHLLLTKAVQDWLGMKNLGGTFGDDQSLTRMNDDGTTFSDIADYIERYPGMFFKNETV
jgi:hypothetical protein